MNLNKLIRPKCGYVLFFILAIFFSYYLFIFDRNLKVYIERFFTELNGAEVKIDKLKFSLLRHKIVLKDLKLANHTNLNNNRLEIDNIEIDFNPYLLIRKKIFIDNVTIEGIKYQVPRTIPAKAFEDPSRFGVPSIIDRISTAIYSKLRSRFAVNPLKNLSSLLSDSNVNQFFEKSSYRLPSIKKTHELKSKMETVLVEWKKYLDVDKRDVTSMGNKSQMETAKNTIIQQYNNFKSEIENIKTQFEEDVRFIKNKLPNFEAENLSYQMFAPEFLNLFERLSYWVGLARRYIPKDTSLNEQPLSVRSSLYGKSIHFGGKYSPYPFLYINKIILRSNLLNHPYYGTVSGEVLNLTTDQPILQKPFTCKIEASFPKKDTLDSKLEMLIDHTKNEYIDKIHTEVATFPVTNFYLSQSGDLIIKIVNGIGALKLDFEVKDEMVNGKVKMNIDQASYEVFSRFHKVQESVRKVFDEHRYIETLATISGPFDNLNMKIESNISEKISEKLRYEFRHELTSSTVLIRQLLSNYINPTLTNLTNLVDETYNKIMARL